MNWYLVNILSEIDPDGKFHSVSGIYCAKDRTECYGYAWDAGKCLFPGHIPRIIITDIPDDSIKEMYESIKGRTL